MFATSQWRKLAVLTLAVFCVAGMVRAAGEIATTADGGAAQSILKKGDRLVIAGDSITEQKLYSRYIEDYLAACTPQLDLWIIQLGWNGETAGGFLGRMDRDCLYFKPNVMTTCYGMNDGGYRVYVDAIGEGYGKNMKAIVEKAKAAGVIVVAGSPGAVDTEYFRLANPTAYNDNLARLGAISRKIAMDSGMVFANVHDPMIKSMALAKAALGKEYSVCGQDGFHPGPNGHVVMAYAFLKAMGLDGQIDTITVDMSGQAKATDGHKVLSSSAGKAEIESSRYPFCFSGDPKSDASTQSMEPFVPFNRDLNRLTLVVANLKADKAKVAWGAEVKSFTREQLAKGINLAAEFGDNPFSEAFKKVDERVAQKQAFETTMIKRLFRKPEDVAKALGDDGDSDPTNANPKARLSAKQNALSKAVRSAVTPVKHTITVEAE